MTRRDCRTIRTYVGKDEEVPLINKKCHVVS